MLPHDKIKILTHNADLPLRRGLEIGPRDAPLLRKSCCNVAYADYADTAAIRENVKGTNIDPDNLVEIDIVTGGQKLSAVTGQKFDYIVASHVAEHVPDLLGWLIDLRQVLLPGGTLGLAIPDRRFTFDRLRAESTLAELLEAYLHGYERPSLRQVVDSAWQSIEISVAQGWRGELPSEAELAKRHSGLPSLLDWARTIHTEKIYADAHCWVFTPASFLVLMEQASLLGLLPFTLDQFHPTASGGYEFYAILKAAAAEDKTEIAASIARAKDRLTQSPAETEFAANHALPAIIALEAEVATLRATLATIHASRSWRLTTPLRSIGRLFFA
jgi:SAM-dependent methyltransferase